VPGSPKDALGIERLKEHLVGFEPRLLEGDRRAAVAVIFRPGAAGAEVLLIHRAEDERDPWSGHLSFPGGRVDPSDADPRAAALRETLEEVGLDLGVHAKEIGRFSDLTAVAHGRRMALVIEPFAFELMGSPELSLNSEAQAALWLPLADLVDQSRRSSMAYTIAGREVQLPRYLIGERVLWGLTLRMLDEVIEVLTGKVAVDWPEGR
jgi:8-oxo-dGTP pyrophosphatase MutT (NUDIX family)